MSAGDDGLSTYPSHRVRVCEEAPRSPDARQYIVIIMSAGGLKDERFLE